MDKAKPTLDLLDRQDLSREQYISLIRNMPDQLLEYRHGILVDRFWSEDDLAIIDAARKEYVAKARWLDYYLLDDMEALWECENTDKSEYKPLAEISVAWHRLAQELFVWQERHPKFFLFSPKQMKSPNFWMTVCEIQFCSSRLTNSLSGMLQEAGYGKVANHENAIRYKAMLNNSEKLQFTKGEPVLSPPIQALQDSAALLTKHDSKFCNARYYQQYARTIVRCYREIRYNENLRPALIDATGALRLLGRGKSTRGFSK